MFRCTEKLRAKTLSSGATLLAIKLISLLTKDSWLLAVHQLARFLFLVVHLCGGLCSYFIMKHTHTKTNVY